MALPEDLFRRLKLIAAREDSSISAMVSESLRKIADAEDGYAAAQRELIRDIRKGYDLGTHGKIGWTRDSLHER